MVSGKMFKYEKKVEGIGHPYTDCLDFTIQFSQFSP